ncbi:Glyceraldehyde-3-phosphate dehydrogenase [Commensalibacter sp. Nvir]|uniref:type I glyceraldehyde-3-phosphate dehydrogenase n=1 Tax=Commensalibacter sp. Nvir TaxID=3069817 RepID=UPI002D493276|nr:Glyceraldehyde-3-phosphate dehydrogenase [Commensalibacter sp. Nvir]
MAIKIAINGFGRIGRLVLRSIIETGRTDAEVVLINDLGSPEANAHLLCYDTVHGRLSADVTVENSAMIIKTHDGRTLGPIKITAESVPSKLPLQNVDVAMECTGRFTTKEAASELLKAGARKVLISAPGKEVDATVVYGVNDNIITKDMTVISNASCTTNCLAPMAKVLQDTVGIERGSMITIHSYTGDQRTVDTLHKDLHRARAAAQNIIPTTTGAAKAVALVIPELKGKLDGIAIRVPTPNVSYVALDFVPSKVPASIEELNSYFKKAAEGQLKSILGYNDKPLVSSDFNHCYNSCTFDATQTGFIDNGKMIRVAGWYDNEWGFSTRMTDTAVILGSAE